VHWHHPLTHVQELDRQMSPSVFSHRMNAKDVIDAHIHTLGSRMAVCNDDDAITVW
jgi:hypothetical protein